MYYWPASGFAFKRGIDKAVDVVVKELRKLSKPTKDAKEIAQVGTISANNAGMEGSIVVEKVKDKKGAYGFNAQTDKYEDMIAAGVIDPTKVTRFALQNAASVASLMLTTQCMVADKPKDESAMPSMPPGGGGYPGMGM